MDPVPHSGSPSPDQAAIAAIRDARAAVRAVVDALDRLDAAMRPASTWAAESTTMNAGAAAVAPSNDTASAPSGGSPVADADRSPPAEAAGQKQSSPQDNPPAPESGWGSWAATAAPMEPAAWPYPSQSAAESSARSDDAWSSSTPADEAAREEVRLAVERLRSELGESRSSLLDFTDDTEAQEDLSLNPERDAAAAGQDVTEPRLHVVSPDGEEPVAASDITVEDHEMASPSSAGEGEEAEPEPRINFDVREQVRRAVEEAKAELQAEAPASDGGSIAAAFDAENLRVPHYEPLLDERFLQPAMLVIDDPEGRVELVRVYRTLARLEVAATANLANYSSHSVTVQLEERKVPDRQDITDAINYAFERECSVDIDGNRASIRLFGGTSRVA